MLCIKGESLSLNTQGKMLCIKGESLSLNIQGKMLCINFFKRKYKTFKDCFAFKINNYFQIQK